MRNRYFCMKKKKLQIQLKNRMQMPLRVSVNNTHIDNFMCQMATNREKMNKTISSLITTILFN